MINCHTKDSLRSLKDKFLVKFSEFKDEKDKDVRLFYGGKEMVPLEKEIGKFIKEDSVVIGFPTKVLKN